MKHIFFLLLILCFASLLAQENHRFININGTSELVRSADQINFSVQIKTIAVTIERSKVTNDNDLAELLSILKKIGINSDDIVVSPIRLGKNYEYDRERQRKLTGYFTDVNVTFRLTDLSKYYELANQLSAGNDFEITSSSYGISDYEIQHKAALENALKAAKEKAEYMAKALGQKLGDVIEIEENDGRQTNAALSNTITVEGSASPEINGTVVIKRSVRVKFALN
jgi:uncharacterized protein YggE